MEATRHAQLLQECRGDLAVAAWHLARARLVAGGYATPTPAPLDLHSAARAIASSVGRDEIPSSEVLAADARAANLEVIG